jgi:ribonuclease VapC
MSLLPSGARKLSVSRAERVFDASAALAILFSEPGAERASELLPADISAVNAAEVLAKLIQKGIPREAAIAALDALNLSIVPFGADECSLSARFVYPQLSLGDRSCLATAYKRGADAVTADRSWTKVGIKVKVTLIR